MGTWNGRFGAACRPHAGLARTGEIENVVDVVGRDRASGRSTAW